VLPLLEKFSPKFTRKQTLCRRLVKQHVKGRHSTAARQSLQASSADGTSHSIADRQDEGAWTVHDRTIKAPNASTDSPDHHMAPEIHSAMKSQTNTMHIYHNMFIPTQVPMLLLPCPQPTTQPRAVLRRRRSSGEWK
jgi:hypothetical protein